uniref:Pentacotripeptide-repeat region of PRORP domain-containing protein n=1 Tax=Lactuca sativa TaxID=4236 RepID=A0A9R1UCA0_LACSA|nr:hypothetical protein LSAT_V11C900491780 [Lactuca sativa]
MPGVYDRFNKDLSNLLPDSGVYNALMNAFIRSRDINSATKLMDEMEANNLLHDNITFHTMFSGLMKSTGIDGVLELYHKMISRNFVPKSEMIVMLMNIFCKNHEVDDALGFWRYLIDKGYCPHSHAVDVLVRSLCSHGRVEEAFECSLQILERGRHLSLQEYSPHQVAWKASRSTATNYHTPTEYSPPTLKKRNIREEEDVERSPPPKWLSNVVVITIHHNYDPSGWCARSSLLSPQS